ncbi:LLM class flavin-dependent oxidoreductase [Roseiarcus sp.]|uniref:LLM class flavin-dependent oxidoreductase n=1 Tax=Roseiarcus sp. TaxID=1969460 RepID=UPI003F9B5B00
MELGVYTFVETRLDPKTGEPVDLDKTFAELLDEIELADRVGLDVFGLGEHHRPDYAISAPAVALAAGAARTKRIRLTSAVTVLSSDDPVRVYQQFATLDCVSGGRAEIMAGRGAFIESFPLFGYDLEDYEKLFSENLELLLAIRKDARPNWRGGRRPPLDGQGVYPRALQNPLPVWIASGGTPQSVARAGALGLPLAIAIIGGEPARFAPLAALYREQARRAGVPESALKLGINGHGFVADTAEAAVDAYFAPYAEVMRRLGRERGWPPLSREQFDIGRSPRGHLMLGSPDDVAAKILAQHEVFRHDRYLMQMKVGQQPHEAILRSIELFGTVVAPKVRDEVAKRKAAA